MICLELNLVVPNFWLENCYFLDIFMHALQCSPDDIVFNLPQHKRLHFLIRYTATGKVIVLCILMK